MFNKKDLEALSSLGKDAAMDMLDKMIKQCESQGDRSGANNLKALKAGMLKGLSEKD